MRRGLLIGCLAFIVASPALAQTKPSGQAAAPAPGPVLVFETEKGTFEIETYPGEAPKTVEHIVGLVKKGFYNGQRVHRVVPGFVVQLGDPQSRDIALKNRWGTGGSGSPIGVAEFSKTLRHSVGMVSMAHAGNPSRADSQFFIVLGRASHLDGKHQIWGRVTGNGMDVVRKIAVGDRIIRASVQGTK